MSVELRNPRDSIDVQVIVGGPEPPTTSQDGSPDAPEAAQADALPPSEAPVPENRPQYSIFSLRAKRLIVLASAIAAFFSPLSAQIYLPALNALASDFDVSITQVNLTVTTYMIFQGITPMFIGSLADAAGRRPAYFICFTIYLAANIGCALAPSYVALLVLRMLQAAGASTTVALAQSVVSDVVTSAERGQYVGLTALPVLLAPAIGPVIGGLMSQYLSWRWIFWLLTIMSGVVFALLMLFLPETCRSIVGDGSIRPHAAYLPLMRLLRETLAKRKAKKAAGAQGEGEDTLSRTVSRASSRPAFKPKKKWEVWSSLVILFEKEMFMLLAYNSIPTIGFFGVVTSMPAAFALNYGLNDLEIGLIYLPMAAGTILGALILGRVVNRNFMRHCKLQGVPFERSKQPDLTEFPIEKARLQAGIPLLAISTAFTFGWGWALQYKAPLAVPCVLLFFIGLGLTGFNNAVNILIVDTNPGYAGAATAANNLTRCLIGAAASAVIQPMIDGIGLGFTFTLLAGLYVVFFPMLVIIMRNGVAWRKQKVAKRRAAMLKRMGEQQQGMQHEMVEHPGSSSANSDNGHAGGVTSEKEPVTQEAPAVTEQKQEDDARA